MLLIVISVMLMLSLTACKKKAKCFFCEEVKTGDYYELVLGKVFICDDCYEETYEDDDDLISEDW